MSAMFFVCIHDADAFVREALRVGLEGLRPRLLPQVFGQTMSDEEIDSIIEYIKSVQ